MFLNAHSTSKAAGWTFLLLKLCSNSPGGGDETNSNMTSRGSGVFVTLQAGNKMALSVSLA